MSSNNSIKTSRWSRFLQRRSISRRLLAWSFSVLVLVGALASFQLSYSIRKEMLELVDNNLICQQSVYVGTAGTGLWSRF